MADETVVDFARVRADKKATNAPSEGTVLSVAQAQRIPLDVQDVLYALEGMREEASKRRVELVVTELRIWADGLDFVSYCRDPMEREMRAMGLCGEVLFYLLPDFYSDDEEWSDPDLFHKVLKKFARKHRKYWRKRNRHKKNGAL